jgi:cytochrome P450
VELSTTAVAYDDARPARIALFAYLQSTLQQRKRNPMDDLFASLMSTEVEGRRLASADVVCNTYNVLLGANVTLPHTASSTLLTLMEQGRYREWAESAEATTTGLDEAIRWGTVANHFLRYTTQDVELPGGTIPAGDAVALWLSSANRDEDVFDDPFAFDIRRQPNKHLGFGVGSHYCVGYAMAKLCLRVLFEEIIDAVDDIQLAGPVEHLRSNLVAGYVHIPVVVRRRHGSNGAGRPKESTDS